ncbi:MAG: hypothetical protein R2827_04850 [Bdellovibrionales bacterium]
MERLPENIQNAYRFARQLSTGREHIIMGEPHRYDPQAENFWLTMVRTLVNGSLVSSSLFVIASDIGLANDLSQVDLMSAVFPPAVLAMTFSGGLQWHAHKVRVFLKKRRFGTSDRNSNFAGLLTKQLLITSTFVTVLRAAMIHSGLVEFEGLDHFVQRVGVTATKSVLMVGLSFGLILRDRTLVRDESKLSSRDFQTIKINNRITLLASFLATLGETLMQSKNPAINMLGTIELTVAAGGAYLYWFKFTQQQGIVELRSGMNAVYRGEFAKAREHFSQMFSSTVQPTSMMCRSLFAH